MPVVGIIHHRGRNTGRPYATPLGLRPATAGGFVMPLTFGESAGWYRNIVAAGSCVQLSRLIGSPGRQAQN
jgi:deazaflavin-dependent oxidoreductase (nitroreductase family)